MITNVLSQPIENHSMGDFNNLPTEELFLDKTQLLFHQKLFPLAISESYQIITLVCVLVTNSIRSLGLFKPQLDESDKKELVQLTHKTLEVINQFNQGVEFFLNPQLNKNSVPALDKSSLSSPLRKLKYSIAHWIERSGVNDCLMTADFYARKKAIQVFAAFSRSQIIKINLQYQEKNLIKKGGFKC